VDAEPEARGGWRSWILMRRSLSQPSKRAYSRVWGPPPTTLAELVRVAGRRWSSEAGLEAGLEEDEVRTWRGWYRHITLALLAHAVLVVLVVVVVVRAQAQQEQEQGALSTKGSG
jgi:SRSO17 transposase